MILPFYIRFTNICRDSPTRIKSALFGTTRPNSIPCCHSFGLQGCKFVIVSPRVPNPSHPRQLFHGQTTHFNINNPRSEESIHDSERWIFSDYHPIFTRRAARNVEAASISEAQAPLRAIPVLYPQYPYEHQRLSLTLDIEIRFEVSLGED